MASPLPSPQAASGYSRVTVLIPSHSYTLNIQGLPHGASIADLKRAISEQCPGRPQVSGQRIIMHGRLLQDKDILPTLEGSNEASVVHLAVHPGAWTGTPPASPQRDNAALPPSNAVPNPVASTFTPSIPTAPPAQPTEPPLPLTLQLSSLPTEFVTHVHANALRILSGQAAIPWRGETGADFQHARRVARTVIKYAGLGWSSALEEDLPIEAEPGKGVQYTSVVVDGLPYLALASPDATPTPAQLKALQILTYTFPLLPLMKHLPRPAPIVTARPRAAQPAPPQNGVAIRRFGINVRVGAAPLPRVAEGAQGLGGDQRVLFDDEDHRAYFPPVPEFRFQFQLHLPPSRVLLQLLFTLSRAALLLYFFPPARQPLWMASIVGWIGWEIYVVLRHAGRDGAGGAGGARPAAQGGAGANAAVAAVPAAGAGNNAPAGGAQVQGQGQNANAAAAPAGPAAGPNPPNTLIPDANSNGLNYLIDRVAIMNLAGESNALSLAVQPPPTPSPPAGSAPAPGTAAPRSPLEPLQGEAAAAVEPSLVHRSTTFLALFITSILPVVWERRRTRLRVRERWVRDMFVFGRPTGGEAPIPVPPVPADGATAAPTPAPPSGAEVAQRRVEGLAGWRKDYVERVVSGVAGDEEL